jgi:hypothetical protein
MNTLLSTLRIVLRTFFAIQLILGIVFWTGNGLQLISLHMVVGFLFVLTLWAIAIAGAFRGVPIGMAAAGIVWGLLIIWLGATQMNLLLGQWHWVIQVLHLLFGFAGIGIGDRMAALAVARSSAPAQ